MIPNLNLILLVFVGLSVVFAIVGGTLANRMPLQNSARTCIIIAIVTVFLFGGIGRSQVHQVGQGVFVLGLSLGFILALSLIAGYLWNPKVWKGGKRIAGMSLLCAGIALSLFGFLKIKFNELGSAITTLGIDKAPPKIEAKADQGSIDNLKSLYFAFETYAQDWDGLPPAEKWMDNEELASKITKNEWLHSPVVSDLHDDKFGYAYFTGVAGKKLNGKKLKEMPDAAKTPLLFEASDLSKSAKGDLTLLPKPGRNNGKNYVLYCDGTVKAE